MTKEEQIYQLQEALKKGNEKKVNDLNDLIYAEYSNLIQCIQSRYSKVYAKNEEERNDIGAEASKAYWEAICTYNKKKGGAFSTWLYSSIEYSLKKWVWHNKLIKLPRRLQVLTNQYNKIVIDFMLQNMGKQPSDQYILMELNKNIGVDEKKLKDIKMARYGQNIISLNSCVDDVERIELQDYIEKTDICENVESIENKCIEEDVRNRVYNCIKKLKKEEYEIVYAVFYENKKQSELAKELGKPKQTINSILNRSIKKLRKMTEIKEIAASEGYSQKIK